MAAIEQQLMQHLRERSAAGAIRQVAARVRDVVDAVAHIAEVKGHPLAAGVNMDDVRLRLEFGVPTELTPLTREFGTQISRGQYLGLQQAGVANVDGLKSATSDLLAQIFGDSIPLAVQDITG